MNRLLTLAAGGLIAGMSMLPVAGFAQSGTAPAGDAKAPVATTMQTETKTVTPSASTAGVTKSHKVETKTEAKGDATMKHETPTHAAKAATSAPSVQAKTAEPGKS